MKRDERLFEAFAEVRSGDSEAAPPFEDVVGGARRRLARRRAGRGGAGLALVALVALLAVPADSHSDPELANRLLATSRLFEGPTTFLLESRPTPLWRQRPLVGGGNRAAARPITRFQPVDPPPGRG